MFFNFKTKKCTEKKQKIKNTWYNVLDSYDFFKIKKCTCT